MDKKTVTVIYSQFGAEAATREYKIEILSSGDPITDCQRVFRMMNHVDGSAVEAKLIELGERSMMPGDGIIIDEKVYFCGGFGWQEVQDRSQLGLRGYFG